MSFDVEFVVLAPRVSREDVGQALEHLNGDDDAVSYADVLDRFTDATVSEEKLRARLVQAAVEVLASSPFILFRPQHALAQRPAEERARYVAERFFECQGAAGRVPASISRSGDVVEFARVVCEIVSRVKDASLYDPQTNQLLDVDQARHWAHL